MRSSRSTRATKSRPRIAGVPYIVGGKPAVMTKAAVARNPEGESRHSLVRLATAPLMQPPQGSHATAIVESGRAEPAMVSKPRNEPEDAASPSPVMAADGPVPTNGAAPEPGRPADQGEPSISAGSVVASVSSEQDRRPTDPAEPASGATLLNGATTVLLKVAPEISVLDDLDRRRVATSEADGDRREAIAAAFRSLSLSPTLSLLSAEEAEKELEGGKVSAVATLVDDTAAAQAPGSLLKLRIDPYTLRRPR